MRAEANQLRDGAGFGHECLQVGIGRERIPILYQYLQLRDTVLRGASRAGVDSDQPGGSDPRPLSARQRANGPVGEISEYPLHRYLSH